MSVPSQSRSTPSTGCFRLRAIAHQSNRSFRLTGGREFGAYEAGSFERQYGDYRAWELGLQKTGRDAIVAVKLHILKERGNAGPAGHGGDFHAAYPSHRGKDDISEAQRLTYQNDLKFNRGSDGQLLGAKKIGAGRTNIARDERNRKFFRDSAHTSKTQREFQSGTRVFPMLRMNTDGMRRHADETPGLHGSQERRHAQSRHAQRLNDRLRSRQDAASFCA